MQGTLKALLALHNGFILFVFLAFFIIWLIVARNRSAALHKLRMDPKTGATELTEDPQTAPQVALVMPVKGTHASSDANWISQTTRHGY